MNDRIAEFWDALGKLTYAEALEVAATIRNTVDPEDFDLHNAYDWAALLNSARQAATSEEADA
jgi:hypothetical protein